MPELPEVETVMRGLSPVLTGAKIADVFCGEKGLRAPFPDGLTVRLIGIQIERLSRRAKYILCHLENKNILVLHLGMSGRIRILAPNANTLAERHDHFTVTLSSGHKMILNDARRFGMVFDLTEKDMADHKAFKHLGPEPLSDDFSAMYLMGKLKGKSVAIKIAIMDQQIVVGVGNIYACEALFRAGISPLKQAGKLSESEIISLISCIQDVLKSAIEAGGSTLKDHRLPNGNFGYFQQKLFVYGREDKPCLEKKCKGSIERIVQAGRSTFYCPSCQMSG